MKIGLIGLPSSGKTTFFSLLTDKGSKILIDTKGKTEANYATIRVPDQRIDFLQKIYEPKKVTYATIDVIDIHGIIPESSSGKTSPSHHFFDDVRKTDALVHVVRAFEDEMTVHMDGSVDPFRDIQTVNLELIFTDLELVDNRISAIKNSKKNAKVNPGELEALQKCKKCLEEEKPLNGLDLEEEEINILKSFDFLTYRPMIYLINMDESQFHSGRYMNHEKVREFIAKIGAPLIEICAKTELEITELDEQDRMIFMADLGIVESGLHKLVKAMYRELGLISFLTVGEDEVRAWPIKKGSNAKLAGGKIHSDIARGFIRAEVVKFTDYEKYGSMQKIKEKGLMRSEGKESIIEDGDVINFRFNV
jgi:ribosome-binding ATPase